MRYVAYYRVSTQKQGVSGLGLEAQQAAVHHFVKDAPILAHFTEVESGKKNQRPRLLEAIAEAKRLKATLVIAKLDRLSRNAAFIFTLRDTKVDFVCCDIPDANTLTIGIFAVIAQHEQETISKRTRDSLAAKRARGETLGNMANITEEGRAKGRLQHHINAQTAKENLQAAEMIRLYRAEGKTFRAIAKQLNDRGYHTRRGGEFNAGAVHRLSVTMVAGNAAYAMVG